MLDGELVEPAAEAAGGEGRAVVRAEGQLARFDVVQRGGAFYEGDRFPSRNP
jgi:hypothetical protein